MGKLLILNPRMDVSDPHFTFITKWVNALAAYFDQIDVVTELEGEIDVAQNVAVYSSEIEDETGTLSPYAGLDLVVRSLVKQERYEACFAHMAPDLLAAVGYRIKEAGIPIVFWYADVKDSESVRESVELANYVVSSVASAVPVQTDKLKVIGQGIDTNLFYPRHTLPTRPYPLIVHTGRLNPIKNQDKIIKAVEKINVDVILIGESTPLDPPEYREELEKMIFEYDVVHRVRMIGAVDMADVVAWNQQATLGINLTPEGSFDKAALEQMSCGIPTLVSNSAFAPIIKGFENYLYLEDPEDIEGLAKKIQDLLRLPIAQRVFFGRVLRNRVNEAHNFKQLIERLVEIIRHGDGGE
ncbi:hypothetical protein MASR2M15_17890 [Anaerolineales bacterium]